MRRTIIFIMLILAMGILYGCSGGGNSPVNPSTPLPSDEISDLEVLYMGSFDIDLENNQIIQQDRQIEYVYNITGFLPDKCPGGCFRFRIVSIVGTVLEIELTIENPTLIQVYDVRIQYIDTYGKTVLNPDSYTDFMGTMVTNIYPFTAFMKEDDNRAFPVGPSGIDSETLFLDYPPGALAAVNYAITAHLPGQTPEPYQISEMAQIGTLTTSGGNATISCRVGDHQSNISNVILNATPITGGYKFMTPVPADPGMYETTVSNTQGAPLGSYIQMIMAQSPNPQNLNTYNFVEITVTEGSNVTAVFTSDPYPDALTCQSIDFDASMSDGGGYPISEYHWDWDYTGDPSGFESDLVTASPYVWHQYETEGTHMTGLVVVNSAPSPESSDVFSDNHNLTKLPSSDYSVQQVERVSFNPESDDLWMPGSNAVVVDNNDVVHVFAKNSSQLIHQWWDNGTTGEEIIGPMSNYSHQSAQLDSMDFIHIVWYDGSALVYSNNSGGGWSTPEIVVSEFESNPYSYSMGINGQDELMLIYYQAFSDTHPMLYCLKDSDGWSDPALVTYPPYQTGSAGSELAIMLACMGTPGYFGSDFHAVWTQQFTEGFMNPVATYSKFDRDTETWSTPEHAAPGLAHYQDWSDVAVTEDGDVFIGSSYYWDNCFVARKDATTGLWNIWMIASTSNDEYTATIGANNDGTVCVAYWERIGYPDPDPFEVQFKVFDETMSQAEVDAIAPTSLDPSTSYAFMYSDIYVKECSYYVAFMDQRDTSGGNWTTYFGRISP